MHEVQAYLHHAIDGRLRLKVPSVKGSPSKAAQLESRLRSLAGGVERVMVNPTTGSVLITYDPHRIEQSEIFERLARLGCRPQLSFQPSSASDPSTPILTPGFGRDLARTVLHSTMEFALQRLIYALI